MSLYVGRLAEFRLEADGRRTPVIACPSKAVPAPGQYMLAHDPADTEALLAEPLFLHAVVEGGFLAAPGEAPLPASWEPGGSLQMRGPLGKGFQPPGIVRNLALAALGDTAARLLPLLALTDSAALFTDLPVRGLPARVEVQPLNALPEALDWADFLAADAPLGEVERLVRLLPEGYRRGQALVTSPMPCGGLADCGVCTLKARRKPVLLCKDGPVVDLSTLIE